MENGQENQPRMEFDDYKFDDLDLFPGIADKLGNNKEPNQKGGKGQEEIASRKARPSLEIEKKKLTKKLNRHSRVKNVDNAAEFIKRMSREVSGISNHPSSLQKFSSSELQSPGIRMRSDSSNTMSKATKRESRLVSGIPIMQLGTTSEMNIKGSKKSEYSKFTTDKSNISLNVLGPSKEVLLPESGFEKNPNTSIDPNSAEKQAKKSKRTSGIPIKRLSRPEEKNLEDGYDRFAENKLMDLETEPFDDQEPMFKVEKGSQASKIIRLSKSYSDMFGNPDTQSKRITVIEDKAQEPKPPELEFDAYNEDSSLESYNYNIEESFICISDSREIVNADNSISSLYFSIPNNNVFLDDSILQVGEVKAPGNGKYYINNKLVGIIDASEEDPFSFQTWSLLLYKHFNSRIDLVLAR
ncbi:hypothetical protein BB560_006197, partial [Smittium megazygosporum]